MGEPEKSDLFPEPEEEVVAFEPYVGYPRTLAELLERMSTKKGKVEPL